MTKLVRSMNKQGGAADRRFFKGLKYASVISVVIVIIALIAVMSYIIIEGVGYISWDLLFGTSKVNPTLLPAFAGTLTLIVTASLIAVPFGIFTAVFLVEYMGDKGKLVRIIRLATETLAGIPSIVYGLFGYLIFVVAFGMGYSLLAGGLTVSIMILPVIVRSTEESLLSVPKGYREGSLALGASKVRTIFKIVLPAASSGIVTAIILAIGRIISESAVLIVTIGMVVNNMPTSLLSPGTTLALDIYYYANNGEREAAAATAVVLLIFVVLINLLAAGIGKILKKKAGGL